MSFYVYKAFAYSYIHTLKPYPHSHKRTTEIFEMQIFEKSCFMAG
jgi:hypothetical protein